MYNENIKDAFGLYQYMGANNKKILLINLEN